MLVKLGPLDRRKKAKRPREPLPRRGYSGVKREEYGVSAFYALLSAYKKGAADRSLRFDLLDEEFLQLTSCDCHYCGIEPQQVFRRNIGNGPYIYNGIDRKDNAVGYTMENCVSCCKVCNYSKSSSGETEFIEHCLKVADHHRSKIDLDNLEELCEYSCSEND
jgi:hypothetical protein